MAKIVIDYQMIILKAMMFDKINHKMGGHYGIYQ